MAEFLVVVKVARDNPCIPRLSIQSRPDLLCNFNAGRCRSYPSLFVVGKIKSYKV